MSDHPAVVTIKAFSSGRHASIVNVMTVINNPESTTMRTLIASEINAANPSLNFDEMKHITTVETGEETDIKQLLDLPISLLLKQQVGIQDGVIRVTTGLSSPLIEKPPPRAAGKGRTSINNKNRINPFKDASRENFPPLEEFFSSNAATKKSGKDKPSRSLLTMNSSSPGSRSSLSICNDFSLDMSIAGQAALAQHRYQIGKYGIDNDKNNSNCTDDNISPLSDEKDWDNLMDSNDSFALTDVNNTLFQSRLSESQSLSPSNQTELSDSYFDRSIVNALKTPEKCDEDGTMKPSMYGVTMSRGNNDLDYSDDENSKLDASTQVTNTSNGLNGIFRAAMKMHDDLDRKPHTAADENESTVSTCLSTSRQGRKNLSVSFAVDESFAIEHQSSSKKRMHMFGDEELNEFGDFLLSPIDKEKKDATFCIDSSFIVNNPSPTSSCVKDSCLETSSHMASPDISPSSSCEVIPTPIVSEGTHAKFNEILRTKSLDDCFRRKLLFESPEQKRALSEIDAVCGRSASPSPNDLEISHKDIRRSSSSSALDKQGDRNDTQSTVPLEESSFVSQKGPALMSAHGRKAFGSDAASRLNSQSVLPTATDIPSSSDNCTNCSSASKSGPKSTEKEESGLSGLSKLFAFGFEMIDVACSSGRVPP